MRLGVLVAVCACHASASVPLAPLPPDEPAAPPTTAPMPQQPLSEIPQSHPTGDPIIVHFALPKIGDIDHHTLASTFVENATFSGPPMTRYQRTERSFQLRVKILEVDGDHPSRVEVDATVATETVALGETQATAKHEDQTLLDGTYIVTPGPGHGFERDEAFVARGNGTKVFGREQEELGSLLGESLRSSSPLTRYLANHPMRLGDAILLGDADKKELVGEEPIPGAFTFSLVKTDGKTATYQLDVVSQSTDNDLQTETRVQSVAIVELATGRVIDQRDTTHKTERSAARTDDTISTSSLSITSAN